MKRIVAILFVVALAFTMISGCAAQLAGLEAKLSVIETKVQAIDWSKAVTYWQDFVKFADEAAPVVCGMFKNDTSTVGKIMNVVGDADSAVTTLSNTVAAYKAGTLTEADVIAAAQSTEKNVVAAVNLVATAKANPTQAPTSVPTIAPVPAGASK